MADGEPRGKYNVQFGNVSHSAITVGDYNTIAQNVGLTPLETEELRSVFGEARRKVEEQAGAEERDEALAQADELERAVVKERDPGRIRSVLRWFKENAPQLAGTVVSVVIHPLVGKVVEGAGQAIADEFRALINEEA